MIGIGIRGQCECGFDVQLNRSEAEENVYAAQCGACDRIHAFTIKANTDQRVEDAADNDMPEPTKAQDQSPVARVPRKGGMQRRTE